MKPVAIVAMTRNGWNEVELALDELGYEVRRATSIVEFRQTVAECPQARAVFTELALPDGNWRDLLDQAKTAPYTPSVVLCTEIGTAELWWDALECGVLDILAPPYSVQCLKRILAEA